MLPWAWVKRGARPPVHSQEVGPPASLGKPMLTYLVPELPAQHSARRRLATPLLLSQGANQLPVKTHADISARMTPISTNSLLPIPTCSQPQTLTIDPHMAPTSCSHLCLLGNSLSICSDSASALEAKILGKTNPPARPGPPKSLVGSCRHQATVQSKGGIHRQRAFAQQFQTQGQAEGYSRAL